MATYGKQIGSGGGGGGVSAGSRVTASVDQGSLTTGAISGSTDGGYELEGDWWAGTGGDTNLLLQFNGVTTGYVTVGTWSNASGVSSALLGSGQGLGTGVADTAGFDVARAGGASGRDRASFYIRITPTDNTGVCQVNISATAFASATAVSQASYNLRGAFLGAITSITLTTLGGSGTAFKAGSFMRWRPLGFTA